MLAARLEPVYFFSSNLCRFRSKFAWALPLSLSSLWTMIFSQKRQIRTRNEIYFQMPDFRDSFTARQVCEGMLTEITVTRSAPRLSPLAACGQGIRRKLSFRRPKPQLSEQDELFQSANSFAGPSTACRKNGVGVVTITSKSLGLSTQSWSYFSVLGIFLLTVL